MAKSIIEAHNQYKKNKDKWQKIRDFYEGEEQVKSKGEIYLPILTKDDYKNYLYRAYFLGATAKSIDIFVAMLFRKELRYTRKDEKDFSDNQKAILNNLNLKGDSIKTIAKEITTEVITLNRCGVLVDYQRVSENITNAKMDNSRPYIITYKAESILNWNVKQINGKTLLSYIKLCEITNQNNGSNSELLYINKTCTLNDDNQFEIKIEKSNDNVQFEEVETIIPLMKGKPLNFIPFYFFDTGNNDWNVKQSIMLPLVNINQKHYLNGADNEWGLHLVGIPTPCIAGMKEAERKKFDFTIGPSKAWVFSNSDTKAFFLEFSGQGLIAYEKAMDKKENDMAKLGTRIIGSKKMVAETAKKAEIDNAAEESQLASIANNISEQLEKVIEFMFEWFQEPTKITIQINTDYIPQSLSPQYIQVMFQSLLSGKIDHQTYFNLLQKEELTMKGDTYDEMMDRISLEGPTV